MQQKKFNISWWRVLIIVLLFCITIALIYGIILYRNIEQSRTEGFDDATNFVLNHTDIVSIEQISYFQADKGYFIIEGLNEHNESFYVYLANNSPYTTQELFIVSNKEVLSVNDLERQLMDDCGKCTLINSTPAMIDQFPLWELTYVDESNRYVIEYKYLENGKTYEKIKLSRK